MAIHKIKYYIFTLIVFLSWVGIASADVVINEFVSDPSDGSEWVELLNKSSNNISLVGWTITDLATPGEDGEHEVVNKELDDFTITGNGIIVIELSGLNNSGDSIGLYNTSLVDRVTYGTESKVNGYSIDLAAPLKGKSGALISGNWVTNQETTKNTANSSSLTEEENNDNEENDNSESLMSSSSKNTEPIIFKITTKIISPKTVTAGIPFSFNSLTTTNTGKTYAVGKFVWNFGDGMTSEKRKSEPFEYTYEYSGEYVVTLSYFDNNFSQTPDVVDKFTIKVIPSEIYISSVGNNTDPFIEIENKSNYEVLLSNWVITGGIHYFNIPNGTTILPNKKIKLSPKITGFVGEDIKSIVITNPNKDVVATYPIIKTKKVVQRDENTKPIIPQNNNLKTNSLLPNSQIINLNDLGADAGGVNINISNSVYILIGLITIIGLGLASFLIIRKRYINENYFERNVRAEDMTIME